MHPQRGVEAPVLWGRVAQYVVLESRAKVEGQRMGRFAFGGENDNEYVLRGMMWADNCWLFCDNKERLVCMVLMIKTQGSLSCQAPEMHLIGWQNTWEQAPGVPTTPSPP